MEKCFRVYILKIVISPALGRERQKRRRPQALDLEQPAAAVGTATRAPRTSIYGLHLNPALATSTVDRTRWVLGISVDIV